jgi:hypothetical protein
VTLKRQAERAVVSWQELRGPPLRIGTAISRAVDVAGDRDREAYGSAAADLVSLPAEQVGQVLAALVRSLLEDQHPDGLDGDDIRTVLGRCYRGAAGWLPREQLDASTFVAVLASALGIHEPGVTYDEITGRADGGDGTDDPWGGHAYGARPTGAVPTRAPTTTAYAWHAPLLIADLLAAGRRPLGGYLDAAFTDIARAETMEMP